MVREKLHTNRYTGLTAFKLHSKNSLIEKLIQLTDNLLTQFNTLFLYDNDLLEEPERIKFELIISERRLSVGKTGAGYLDMPIDEQQYRSIIQKWFADEKKFMDEIIPLLKTMSIQYPQHENSQQPEKPQKNRTLAIIRQHIEELKPDVIISCHFHTKLEYRSPLQQTV